MHIHRIGRHAGLALALFSGTVSPAQAPVHYGFSAHFNLPMADLDKDLNGKVGLGASFQVSIETSPRTILRPRIDIDGYPVSEKERTGTTYRDRVDLGSLGLGADFLYSFSGRNDHGVYGLGGVGVQRWLQTRWSRNTSGNGYWERDDTVRNRTSPWLALGLGYQINQIVGLEVRTVGSKYDALVEGTTGTRTAVSTQLAVACRW